MIKLYHYVHCPFCVRVRMALNFLKIEYESIVLAYDDEETPVKLTGKKMLPIFVDENLVMNESLEIIKNIDLKDQLKIVNYMSSDSHLQIDKLLSNIGSNVHSLAMPYWVWTPEFDNNSRQYFQKKKEIKRGPFSNLVKNSDKYIQQLNDILTKIEPDIRPFYQSEVMTIKDIVLASHLWGMFIVPEFQFSLKIYEYLVNIKKSCGFEYHEDYWE